MILENPGIDPGTSRMQSGRSTIWANPPEHICFLNYCVWTDLEIYRIYITVSSRSSSVVMG